MPKRIESLALAQAPSADRAGVALLASAVLPGAGQFYLREERWVPYLALEAWGWITYANQKLRGRSLEQKYRDLAWSVARRGCGCMRRDTTFPYYEAMYKDHESGAFDMDESTPGIQPPDRENDARTYNGKQWLQAKALFFGGFVFPPGSPEYARALAYYEANAIPREYEWSWGDSNLEQESFARVIGESDDALRSATRTLGLILANHVVSAIDALVTARLQAAVDGVHQIKIGSELAPAGGSLAWRTTIRFTLGN